MDKTPYRRAYNIGKEIIPDYVYDRMGLSIGSVVIITLHGGVIPYVSTVKSGGSNELNLPGNIAPIKKGNIDIWSLYSEKSNNQMKDTRLVWVQRASDPTFTRHRSSHSV